MASLVLSKEIKNMIYFSSELIVLFRKGIIS